LTAPEDLDIDFDNGDIYVGNSNGTIFRIKSDKSRQSTGPVLRVELDKQHNKITFLDLYRGICKADLTNK
jgi:DNA-binding beta-propeller fold protein YncE